LGGRDWIYLVQGRGQSRPILNIVINFRVTQHLGEFLSSSAIGGFSRITQLYGVKEEV
jgi:hypothetical protein